MITEIEFKNVIDEINPRVRELVKILFPNKYNSYICFEVDNDKMKIHFEDIIWDDDGEFVKYGLVKSEEFILSLLFSDIDALKEEKELERKKLREEKAIEDANRKEAEKIRIREDKIKQFEKLKKELGIE